MDKGGANYEMELALYQQTMTYGKVLYYYKDQAVELIGNLAGCHDSTASSLKMVRMIGRAMTTARVESEEGVSYANEFIEAVENKLDQLVNEHRVAGYASLIIAQTWIKSGLKPPACLARTGGILPEVSASDPESLARLRHSMEKMIGLGQKGGTSQDLLEAYSSFLATVPESVQYALVRSAVATPKEHYAKLGSTLLLRCSENVSKAVIDGFTDRLNAGNMNSNVLLKLKIVRNLLIDESVVSQVDQLIEEASAKGLDTNSSKHKIKYNRMASTFVDCQGMQVIASSFQWDNIRFLTLLFFKQGYGVQDLTIEQCNSAAQQQQEYLQCVEGDKFGEWEEVSIGYVKQAVGFALYDGVKNKRTSNPGMIEFARIMGLADVKPVTVTADDVLAIVDPAGRITDLPDQELEKLLAGSKDWVGKYRLVSDWIENSEVLNEITDHEQQNDAIWSILESRRDYWQTRIGRMALLLHEAKSAELDSFIAVLKALSAGWDMKKIPIMDHIVTKTVFDWSMHQPRFGKYKSTKEKGDSGKPLSVSIVEDMQKGFTELQKYVKQPDFTKDWLNGFLIGINTMPIRIEGFQWCDYLADKLGFPTGDDENAVKVSANLSNMYFFTQMGMDLGDEYPLMPEDKQEIASWAEGFLFTWNEFPLHWPPELLGKVSQRMKEMLEDAKDEKIALDLLTEMVTDWLHENRKIRDRMKHPVTMPI